jgi:hypothetical protein
VALATYLSTRDSEPGTPFEARPQEPLWIDGKKVPMDRWVLLGTVTAVMKPQKKKDRPGELELTFHAVRTEAGEEIPVEAFASELAGSTRKRNIGIVAGGAVLGAIIGKQAGGDTEDAILGAAAGAAAGAGAVRALPGRHLHLEEGSELVVTFVGDTPLPFEGD